MIDCRRLDPERAQEFAALRLRGLNEHPADFGEDATEFAATSVEAHRQRLAPRPENAVVFGAFVGGELVGIGGLYRRADRQKVRHRAELFGMYVEPEARRRGVGQALLGALIQYGQGMDEMKILGLGVVATNAPAERLYKRMGFVTWGVESRALLVGRTFYDIAHMDLELQRCEDTIL